VYAITLTALGHVERDRGRWCACGHYAEVLAVLLRLGEPRGMAICLESSGSCSGATTTTPRGRRCVGPWARPPSSRPARPAATSRWRRPPVRPSTGRAFLNRRGGRLTTRGARDVLVALAVEAQLEEEFTSHVLRHTFGTTLVRSGHDLVLVAELMGHRRLETTRAYTRPSGADRERAIGSLPTDR
jgi:hypothetical protein